MRITNRTRNTLLGSRVEVASTFWGRLRGFIGRAEPKRGEGLLLLRCDAVHTFWMSFDLDVLFLDEKGRVLELVRSLAPWKRTRRIPGAQYVLEVPAGTIEASGTQAGDELSWRDPTPYSISVLSMDRTDDARSSLEIGRGSP
jgi:uncharacterized membrane protein (UPF0127 family)